MVNAQEVRDDAALILAAMCTGAGPQISEEAMRKRAEAAWMQAALLHQVAEEKGSEVFGHLGSGGRKRLMVRTVRTFQKGRKGRVVRIVRSAR